MIQKTSIAVVLFNLAFADIPLSATPSWTSVDNDYSTGGALYDITMDGWIDYCTGNGNDMGSNKNAIYRNYNGTLETAASWRSVESGYFSHIYIGDVDKDSLPDLAVVFLGSGAGNQGPAMIYRNTGTGLDSNAWWTSTDQYNSFDCAFGDVDLDGDLDLAAVAGDAYTGNTSPTRIYRNNNGVLETQPYWTSADSSPGDACRWLDLDNDGWLDLIVGYRHKLAVFRNNLGVLDDTSSWTKYLSGWVLRVAVGDYDNDGYQDIAVACNGQLGADSSRVEVYHNGGGILQTVPAYIMLRSTTYCSCVAWGDVNNDGWLDLAAGGWWEPVVVFENSAGVIDTLPGWSWYSGDLVSETVMWGDVRNRALNLAAEHESGDGSRRLFYLGHRPVHSFHHIKVADSLVPQTDYALDPLTGWVTLKNAPGLGADIEIAYTYSRTPDLGVTNWTSTAGNYLFFNTTTGSEEHIVAKPLTRLSISPNPFRDLATIALHPPLTGNVLINIYDINGRLVRSLRSGTNPQTITWDGSDQDGNRLASGVYLLELVSGDMRDRARIVLVR
jgi:hypothetical protein